MQYSPKLKKAMEEIKHIIKRYDIAAAVVLHTPGNAEYYFNVSPSYSCAKINGNELRIRSRVNEDYNGDKQAQIQKLTDTVNMVDLLGTAMAERGMSLLEMYDRLKAQLDIETREGGHTSQSAQNN